MSIKNEQKTVEAMIRLFCKKQHGTAGLCEDCTDMLQYARRHLDKCPYGEEKPVCRNCTTHCYSPKRREKITAVMRYSGPRMTFRHPIMGIRHVYKKFSSQPTS